MPKAIVKTIELPVQGKFKTHHVSLNTSQMASPAQGLQFQLNNYYETPQRKQAVMSNNSSTLNTGYYQQQVPLNSSHSTS